MQFKKLLTDDEAVSPVIGVILMVAITVILAAVIASFVLGLGDNQNVAPQAQWDFNYDSSTDEVAVTHTSGDNVKTSELYFRGTDINTNSGDLTSGQVDTSTVTVHGSIDGESAITSGDTVTVSTSSDGYVLRLIWEPTDGDTSSELAVDRGPNA